VPQALDTLDAEQRHQLYKMLRLRVVTMVNDRIEMKGVLCGDVGFLESEMARPWTTHFTKGFEIEFRALLTDGAQEEVRFERVAVG
jgi:hypothetical protein